MCVYIYIYIHIYIYNYTQELCRVLFDELETRLKGTDEATLMKDLFEGSMQSYVRHMPGGSLEFGSLKSEPFMDISLSIKQFGDARPISTIEEGLRNFVTPETLDGNNQYQLDADASKGRAETVMVDAHKGLDLSDVPYILTLQLKRFDFDYNTMRRIKIKDRVAFGEELDMAPFLSKTARPKRRESLGSPHKGQTPCSAPADALRAVAGGGDSAAGSPGLIQDSDAVYDLYSVMVHSGSVRVCRFGCVCVYIYTYIP